MFLRLLLSVLIGLAAGGLCAIAAARLDRSARTASPLLVSLAGGLLFGWAGATVAPLALLAASFLLASALLVLAVVDVTAFRLPDLVTLPLIAAGLLLSFALPDADPLGHLAGAGAGYGLLALVAWGYRRFRDRDGLGLGDAKLLAAGGAWLGWAALPFLMTLACVGGLVWVAVAVVRRGRAAVLEQLPFGAPLCLAIWLTWLYGAPA